jgi:hypothetical protein
MASQSKHSAQAKAKRQPIPDFEQDDPEYDYLAAAFEQDDHERQQQQERQQ